MAGKIYVGDGSNKAKKPSKIYVGGSDNKAHLVKAVYVGDSSNKARKVWPTSILPNGYTQLEYLGIKTGGINPGMDYSTYPRIVIEFMVPSNASAYGASSIIHMYKDTLYTENPGSDWPTYNTDESYYSSFNVTTYDISLFEQIIDSKQGTLYGPDEGYYVKNNVVYANQTEGTLKNTKYIVDYRNNQNVYLYNSEGYYSISSHNLLYSGLTNHTFGNRNYAFVDSYDFVILGQDRGMGSDIPSSHRSCNIYSCLMYNDSTLIRNFIPSYRNSDNKLGFYDTVNRVFYKAGGDKTYAANDPDLCGHVM